MEKKLLIPLMVLLLCSWVIVSSALETESTSITDSEESSSFDSSSESSDSNTESESDSDSSDTSESEGDDLPKKKATTYDTNSNDEWESAEDVSDSDSDTSTSGASDEEDTWRLKRKGIFRGLRKRIAATRAKRILKFRKWVSAGRNRVKKFVKRIKRRRGSARKRFRSRLGKFLERAKARRIMRKKRFGRLISRGRRAAVRVTRHAREWLDRHRAIVRKRRKFKKFTNHFNTSFKRRRRTWSRRWTRFRKRFKSRWVANWKRISLKKKIFRARMAAWKGKWKARLARWTKLAKTRRDKFQRRMVAWRARAKAKFEAWKAGLGRFRRTKVVPLKCKMTKWYPRPATVSKAKSLPLAKCSYAYASIILCMNAYHYHEAAKSPFGNLDGFGYNYGVRNCGVFKPKFLLANKWTGSQLEVTVNREKRVAAFAFRGTEYKFKDIWTDILFIPRICKLGGRKVGWVHTGFCNAYNSLRTEFIKKAKRYYKRGYKLLITGHSLGGALMTLGLIDIHYNVTKSKKRLMAYNFGSPRVGTRNFVKAFNKTKIKLHRYRNFYAKNQCNAAWLNKYNWCKRKGILAKLSTRCLKSLWAKAKNVFKKLKSEMVPNIPPRWFLFYRHVGKQYNVRCHTPCKKGVVGLGTKCHQPWQYTVGIERKGVIPKTIVPGVHA